MRDKSEEFDQRDKVNILLEEYKVIRSEIESRTGYGMQVWAIAAAATTWLLGQSDISSAPHLCGFVAVLGVLSWFTATNARDIWKCAARTKEIEHEVNSRTGEYLMVWEQLFGAARLPYLAGIFSSLQPLPRNTLPPLDESYRQKRAD